jgi:hypothetical protein
MYQVAITCNRKTIWGGYFKTKEEAIKKRKEMEREFGFHPNHGEKLEPTQLEDK